MRGVGVVVVGVQLVELPTFVVAETAHCAGSHLPAWTHQTIFGVCTLARARDVGATPSSQKK